MHFYCLIKQKNFGIRFSRFQIIMGITVLRILEFISPRVDNDVYTYVNMYCHAKTNSITKIQAMQMLSSRLVIKGIVRTCFHAFPKIAVTNIYIYIYYSAELLFCSWTLHYIIPKSIKYNILFDYTQNICKNYVW